MKLLRLVKRSTRVSLLGAGALLAVALAGHGGIGVTPAQAAAPAVPSVHGLHLGMTPAEVLRLAGPPLDQSPDQAHPWWMHYGTFDICFDPVHPAVEWIGSSELDYQGHLRQGMSAREVVRTLGKPQQDTVGSEGERLVKYELAHSVIILRFQQQKLHQVSLLHCPVSAKHCSE